MSGERPDKNILLRGGRVLTMDPELGDFDRADVLIAGGRIAAVAPDLPAPSGAEVLDVSGDIVMPGLVDTHTHMWNGVWRTFVGATGDPRHSYQAMGEGMGPLFRPEESYLAVRAAAFEMLSSGITTTHNWAHNIVSPEHADAEIHATTEAGIRTRFSYGYRWDMDREQPMDVADVLRVRDQYDGPMSRIGMALRNDITPDPSFTAFASLAVPPHVLRQEIDFAREHAIPLTMHILNPGAAQYWIDNDYVGPDNLIVHGYHWTREEWEALGAAGARVSISPYSALMGRKTLVKLGDMLEFGVRAGLSFDHMNRSGSADMFRLMHVMALNEALRVGQQLPWRKAVELGTIDGARTLDIEDQTGSLTPGKAADIIVLNGLDLTLVPLVEPYAAVANSAGPRTVSTVIVDGVVRKRDGEMVDVDVQGLAHEVSEMFRHLRTRYDALG